MKRLSVSTRANSPLRGTEVAMPGFGICNSFVALLCQLRGFHPQNLIWYRTTMRPRITIYAGLVSIRRTRVGSSGGNTNRDIAGHEILHTHRSDKSSPSVEENKHNAPKESIASTYVLAVRFVRILGVLPIVQLPDLGGVLVVDILILSL